MPGLGLIEVVAVHPLEFEDDEIPKKPILDNWELVALTSTEVEIKLDFSDNMLVSSYEEPDLLFVQMDLSQYTDENGQTLPPIIKMIMIPRQMNSEEEAALVEQSGDTASTSTVTTTVVSVIVSLFTSNSLSQVWGLIESLQVTTVLPLLDVKTPGNVQTFLEGLEALASFDIIPFDDFTAWWMSIPESEALSLNFQEAGYDTELMVPNLGTMFYLILW